MKRLFLDDIRNPKDCTRYMNYSLIHLYNEEWTVVRSYNEFVKYIKDNGMPDLISFDHDLGMEVALDAREKGMSKRKARELKQLEKTGYDCAKWLVDYCIDNNLYVCDFIVHSANPIGALNIHTLLDNFKKYTNGKTDKH